MVRVGSVSPDRSFVVREHVAVEPQAVGRVMQVERGQRGRVGDVKGHDRVGTLALVLQVGDNGRGRVDAELVGDRLLGLRRAVVVRGQRQLVHTIGQVPVLGVAQIQDQRLTSPLDPRHPSGRIQRGLPVLVAREGRDRLSRSVRVRGVDRVHAAQRARAGFENRGSARGNRAREDVLARAGQTDTISILDQGVVSQLLARGSVVDPGGERVSPVLGGEGVENGGLAPVTVEAQVGHGQVGLGRGLRGETHESIEEGAVGRVLRDGGVEVGARLDIHAHRDLAVRGNGNGRALTGATHGRAGVGDVHALASPIGGLAGEEPTLNNLGEGLRAQRVGGLRAGQVVQRDVEVPALRTIPQVRLGPGLLGGADHGRIHGRGRGRQDIRQARSLLAR